MFTRKITTSIVTLIAAAGFATATIVPAVSQADPIEGSGAPAATCSYGEGTYQVGDRISVINGAHYDNYYCGEDGEWHLVEQPQSQVGVLKAITVKAVAAPVTKKVPPRAPLHKKATPHAISHH
jgi:hypothetical protein